MTDIWTQFTKKSFDENPVISDLGEKYVFQPILKGRILTKKRVVKIQETTPETPTKGSALEMLDEMWRRYQMEEEKKLSQIDREEAVRIRSEKLAKLYCWRLKCEIRKGRFYPRSTLDIITLKMRELNCQICSGFEDPQRCDVLTHSTQTSAESIDTVWTIFRQKIDIILKI